MEGDTVSYGRRKIYSEQREITAANVRDEVNTAYAVHCQNQSEIETLWNEYRGQSKILHKTKEIREEINHKIHEARLFCIKMRAGARPPPYVKGNFTENTQLMKRYYEIARDA